MLRDLNALLCYCVCCKMYTIMLELTVSVKILEQLPVIQVNPEQLTEFTQFVHVGEGGDIDITGN